jgi:hypothetical protein
VIVKFQVSGSKFQVGAFNLIYKYSKVTIMSKVERFEDLKVWQLARELCQTIHKLTMKDLFSKDFKLIGQIKGSSGSIMDNIAEGFISYLKDSELKGNKFKS